jgi:PTH1 family peptidyl-tRNA hydrolase
LTAILTNQTAQGNEVKLIVGLGNIGIHFEGTRHNLGFEVIDMFAANYHMVWQLKDKFKATVAEATLHSQKVLLLKPTTYYNLSGDAVRAAKDFYKLANNDILVVHDELDLPFGTVRSRSSGSDAGNNGMKSIIATLGEDIPRLRLGIRNEHLANQDAADFVLGQLTQEERQKLPQIKNEAINLIDQFIQHGGLEHTSTSV